MWQESGQKACKKAGYQSRQCLSNHIFAAVPRHEPMVVRHAPYRFVALWARITGTNSGLAQHVHVPERLIGTGNICGGSLKE
jgi:hypothetical protein